MTTAAERDRKARAALKVVERQFETYSAKDLDGYMACFAEDAAVYDFNGARLLDNKAEIEARYRALFRDYPENRALVLNRMVVGSTVIDHEEIQRSPSDAPYEVAAIYSTRHGLITRIDFVKA